ncbi:aminotransferase class V-fold PLP-dependent enzyme [Streptomyces sp. NPDC008001]|uniref:aminotransferase class V-fold PLP-dependent enzyme n=1 Tax=Streptomyces sp. NPDC008001 TaxID=3364804 RepID=UPI0036E66048
MDGPITGADSGRMDETSNDVTAIDETAIENLAPAQFAPGTVYLNTAATGLLPAAAVTAMSEAATAHALGRPGSEDHFAVVDAVRSAFARLVGVPARRVATGSSAAVYCGLIAQSLPEGAEVLCAEGDFSSLVNPFHVRAALEVRTVPLEKLAAEVRPGTALVAVSAVQSADGRIADLDAIGAAARAHGARTLVDISQSAGWLPTDAGAFDFTVCVGYKWLMGPRGTAFLTVPEDLGGLTPVFAGWVAAEKPWDSTYGPVTELASSARRYDENPALLSYTGALAGLLLIEELGTGRIAAHDRALADRFRAGLDRLGHRPVPADGSPIVSVPGLDAPAERLSAAGIRAGVRAGRLRVAFHLYNGASDVDAALEALARP